MPKINYRDSSGKFVEIPIKGYTPQKGVDYYTDADKSELVEEVSAKTSTQCANAIKSTAKGDIVRVSDVSPLEHTTKVTISGDGIDPTSVTVTRYGEDENDNFETFTPSTDGTVEIKSLSPVMTLLTDTEGVTIDLEYNQDTNKVLDSVKSDMRELDDTVSQILQNSDKGDTSDYVPKYELIQKIIVGYSVLTSIPTDWDTNYTSYYKNTGTLREPVYTALTEIETWEAGKYYSYTEPTGQYPITVEKEPNGENISFSKLYIYWEDSVVGGSNTNGAISLSTSETFSCAVDTIGLNGNTMFITNLSSTNINKHIVMCEVNGGLLEMRNYQGSYGQLSNYNTLTQIKPSETITGFKIRGTGTCHLMGNTEIYVYGVRA